MQYDQQRPLAAVAVLVVGASIGLTALLPIEYLLPLAAFIGGLVAVYTVYLLADRGGQTDVATMLLGGISISAIAGAGIGFFIFISTEQQLRDLSFWMMGSLGGITWTRLVPVAPLILLGVVGLPLLSRYLDVILMGETEAHHLGFNVERTKRLIIVLTALTTGASVAVTGVIGFVGLVVPHLVRLVAGPGNRIVLTGSIGLGAALLLLADLVISYILRGLTPRRAGAATAALMLLAAASALTVAAPGTAIAQTVQATPGQDAEEVFALKATLETRLAYVLTGDTALDSVSHDGLKGLSTLLRQRTAVEPGDPIGVDIERDDLTLFPVLYWPVSVNQRPLSNRSVEKLNAYLRGGGSVLFDTREQSQINFDPFGVGGPESAKLRDMLSALDIPALIPVPKDHVVNKSFYLLKEFPGRWTGGTVWIERRGGRHNDGVSSVIIGSNDWAGAWAVDRNGAALFPISPGGERQRELAYRFGVNWVMYALTGNYKTDQVHVPAIIERLGQ